MPVVEEFRIAESLIEGNKIKENYDRKLGCRKPCSDSIDELKKSFPGLFRENTNQVCNSKYDFNLLNINAYLDNWNLLHWKIQSAICDFVESDLKSNCYRFGMKNRSDFEKHLLLLAGSEIWNIKQFPHSDMVHSNLKTNGQYGKFKTWNSIIDARTCQQLGSEFSKRHNLPLLFLRRGGAQVVLFESDESYRNLPDNLGLYRERVREFNRENVKFLRRMQRHRKIRSFIYSHEVSCDSILEMKFRPHTHAVVFFESRFEPPDLASKMKLPGRSFKSKDEIHREFRTVEKFIKYIHGAYSLVGVYERDYRDGNVRDLNVKTVQALRNIIDIHGKNFNDGCIKRFGYSKLPKKIKY